MYVLHQIIVQMVCITDQASCKDDKAATEVSSRCSIAAMYGQVAYLHHFPARLVWMLDLQCKKPRRRFGGFHMFGKLLQNLANALHVEADILQQICDALSYSL